MSHLTPHAGPRVAVVTRERIDSPMPRRGRTPGGGRWVRIVLACGHVRVAREQWAAKKFGYCADCFNHGG